MLKHKSLLVGGVLLFISLLSGAILPTTFVSAETSGEVDVTVTIPSNCSLSATNNNLVKTINPGTSDTIGTSNLKALCNDPNGFAIYAVGYTDEVYGKNVLSTVLTAGTNNYDIASGTAESGDTSNWSMYLTSIAGDYAPTIENGYDTKKTIPTTYTKVVSYNSNTDASIGGNFSSTYTAYIAPTQPASSYQGKVKFTLVHPNVLTWQEDSQNPGIMIPGDVQPNTLDRDPEAPIGGCPASSPILQNVSSWGSEVALGDTIDAIDSRDNQCYKVSRFKMNSDGTETALWMSNLNLGAETLVVSQLDNTNTHLDSGVSAILADVFTTWNRATSGSVIPAFTPITTSNSANGLTKDSYDNKYGTLYNYAAASAGTYTYAGGAGTGDATSDLCPAGWRLPTDGNNGEFKKLVIDGYNLATGSTWNAGGLDNIESILGFSRAGYFGDGSMASQGIVGDYWSSKIKNVNSMNSLLYADSYLATDAYGHITRSTEISIRCIAQ